MKVLYAYKLYLMLLPVSLNTTYGVWLKGKCVYELLIIQQMGLEGQCHGIC